MNSHNSLYTVDSKISPRALPPLVAEPTIYAVAGSPGAGKTTFIVRALEKGLLPRDASIHDCDAVMCSLDDYKSDRNSMGPIPAFIKWELPAREIAEADLGKTIEAGNDVIYDRSCGLLSSYLFLKHLIEKKSYRLVMHVLYIHVSEALARTRAREELTGRHIPEETLRERLRMLSGLWPSYLALSQEAYLYESCDNEFRPVAKYGKGGGLQIKNPQVYEEFLSANRLLSVVPHM